MPPLDPPALFLGGARARRDAHKWFLLQTSAKKALLGSGTVRNRRLKLQEILVSPPESCTRESQISSALPWAVCFPPQPPHVFQDGHARKAAHTQVGVRFLWLETQGCRRQMKGALPPNRPCEGDCKTGTSRHAYNGSSYKLQHGSGTLRNLRLKLQGL